MMRAAALIFAAGLAGCSIQPVVQYEAPNTHCARYLIYDMCGHDADQDGSTDYFFFADDDQIFLLREGFTEIDRPLHPCYQVMSSSFQEVANDTLDPVVQNDPKLTRQTKQALLANYLKLFPTISACQVNLGRGPEDADDFLGD